MITIKTKPVSQIFCLKDLPIGHIFQYDFQIFMRDSKGGAFNLETLDVSDIGLFNFVEPLHLLDLRATIIKVRNGAREEEEETPNTFVSKNGFYALYPENYRDNLKGLIRLSEPFLGRVIRDDIKNYVPCEIEMTFNE